MAENKMKEVAELLGVELNEPFKIKGTGFNPYILNRDGLLYDKDGYNCYSLFSDLLCGIREIEKPILTEKEKRYLEGVIEPFKDRVAYIEKRKSFDKRSFLVIVMKTENNIPFPSFKNDEMYKGMKADKEYPLEELRLFEEE